jgi:hypothetical protein
LACTVNRKTVLCGSHGECDPLRMYTLKLLTRSQLSVKGLVMATEIYLMSPKLRKTKQASPSTVPMAAEEAAEEGSVNGHHLKGAYLVATLTPLGPVGGLVVSDGLPLPPDVAVSFSQHPHALYSLHCCALYIIHS